jgi:hypothetical protein
MSLAAAIATGNLVRDGDIVYLRDGTYTGDFTSTISGNA